jgi:RTX calcium-binding nonapeptide repeat (4 copies)
MATNPQLLYAILSMDAYHQGAPGGLRDLLLQYPSEIDDTIRSTPRADNAIGFSAQSYTRGGETIIVYRGTDDGGTAPPFVTPDTLNGYSIAFGASSNPQAEAAIAFYKSFLNGANPVDPASVILVGQSLGGGLAGYVGALYGREHYVFDSMPYQAAVAAAYDRALNGTLVSDGNGGMQSIPDPAFRAAIYGAGNPAVAPNFSGQHGAYVVGESIQNWTYAPGSRPYGFEVPFDPFDPNNTMTGGDRHTVSTLVTLMFAGQLVDTQWQSQMRYIWPAWRSNEVASAAGFKTAGPTNNLFYAADVMAVAIAYTAVNDQGPFGTAAIRALFDDATDLGKLYKGVGVSNYISGDSAKTALAEIVVQYAGDQAFVKSIDQVARAGIFELSTDGKIVSADLNPTKWLSTFYTPEGQKTIVGRDHLISSLIGTIALQEFFTGSNALLYSEFDLWSPAAQDVTRIKAAATAAGVTLDAADAAKAFSTNDGGAVLIGGDGVDTLTGGKGSDLIIGGGGADVLRSGGGKDLIFGNAGNDTFIATLDQRSPTSSVTFFGGLDFDTADYMAAGGAAVMTKSQRVRRVRFCRPQAQTSFKVRPRFREVMCRE